MTGTDIQADFDPLSGKIIKTIRIAMQIGLLLAVLGTILEAFVAPQQRFLLMGMTLACLTVSIVSGILLARFRKAETREKSRMLQQQLEAQEQIEELFGLTDTLQSADGNEDAAQVLAASGRRLLPGCGGALYVFNNSRDRLDLVNEWDMPDGYSPVASLTPSNCWALKRGKDHLNEVHEDCLQCSHYVGEVASIEVPMIARGKVYGLLILADRGGDGANVDRARRVARALADSTSLALSNISLREQLRTQTLRDPMTGLYNRRYMEDALERFIATARRKDQSTAALMIDLDNFKKLNDEHGHAKGDAVLKEVAAQLVAAVRPSDIVCRYGGEELLVLLPDCNLQEAAERAEQMRSRVASLSQTMDCPVSASFGVSAMPECSHSASELLSSADAALYVAKDAGKDQVRIAPKAVTTERTPKLVASS
ncbi:sensor domain-containing diguanylate cyclase [Aurantiacibacter sediminis]|uniref:diguanylate cyclase n=1 Tax=Aurantiacibacter sediminis TaxID=2793064 RepID=A0ABS0N4C1_9SPHN|nr:GGDEF domain-containing protein [Aurantiacibacter sediminis]MBH5322572.1 GGDEF domain-containing protein [Aurantiacibacter sediminis]